MEIDFLRCFDFPQNLIDSLRSQYGKNLLPLQEKVIREGRLFDRENLLVCAPTSSGKTFLAEILFLYHALKGRNTILLVPTKALASQRHRQLSERYKPFGYDILLSTRDHPFHDRRIQEGRFHLAVVIYEKMRSLLAQNNAFTASLGCCVIDEIHYLFHPTRGPDLEILLTRLRNEENLQMLGLSAMVSDPRIADWMKSRLIVDRLRPVELRQGVLCQGRFSYREFNSGKDGTEDFFASDTADEGQAMLEAARFFAGRGETTLLFWPMRDLCYTAARKLADLYDAEDDFEIPELNALEPTSLRDFLAYLLPRRIAVHTSDLSPQERDLVERMARAGEIVLICATSTLAEGVNFPVVNVLTTRRMYAAQPQDAQNGRRPSAIPISQDRLWNMIGRAGRLGLSEYGRGIVVAASLGDVDGLLSLYIHSAPPAPVPVLNQIPFGQVILKTMGYCGSFTLESCRRTLLETLSGKMGLLQNGLDERIEQNCRDLAKNGYVAEELGTYYPTPLGDLVMKGGLSELSARRLNDFVSRNSEEFSIINVLLFTCTLREADEVYLPVSRSEIRSHAWSRAVAQLAEDIGIRSDSYLKKILAEPAKLREEHHSAFKKTLLIFDWIGGREIPVLEKRYGVYSGMIHRLGDEIAWLLGCMTDVAASQALDSAWIASMGELQERILFGLPREGLAWAPLIRKQLISRASVLVLLQSGFNRPSAFNQENRELLRRLLPNELFDPLLQTLEAQSSEPSFSPAPFTLEFDERRPDKMIVDGISVPLTPLQSRLVQALSFRPGSCVAHEDLIKHMWPNGGGDKKQVWRKKNELLRKVAGRLNRPADGFIEALTGLGLVLNAQVRRYS
jgi:helicase